MELYHGSSMGELKIFFMVYTYAAEMRENLKEQIMKKTPQQSEERDRGSSYVSLALLYPETENSSYRITKKVFRHNSQTMVSPEYAGQEEGDIIVVLYDKKKSEIVMSDSWMERETNLDFVSTAKGDVLIAGLGLGMVILAIQDKLEVDSITVVEKDKELASLVLATMSKHFNAKVKVVYSDIMEWTTEEKFNTIYFDIWNTVGDEKDYEQMCYLKENFKKNRVKPLYQSPISCWREQDSKRISESAEDDVIWW